MCAYMYGHTCLLHKVHIIFFNKYLKSMYNFKDPSNYFLDEIHRSWHNWFKNILRDSCVFSRRGNAIYTVASVSHIPLRDFSKGPTITSHTSHFRLMAFQAGRDLWDPLVECFHFTDGNKDIEEFVAKLSSEHWSLNLVLLISWMSYTASSTTFEWPK